MEKEVLQSTINQWFPLTGMGLFLFIYATIIARLFLGGKSKDYFYEKHLPLDESPEKEKFQ